MQQGGRHGRRSRLARWVSLGGALAMTGSLFVVGVPDAGAALPGRNGKLACQSDRAGNSDIWTFNPNGTELEPVNLTTNPAVDGRPKWSPDGRQIAFESNRDGNTELWVMNADGSNPTQLTFTLAGSNSPGGWSPDGSSIVFQSTRDGNFEIYKIDVDGTNEVRLTNLPVEDSLPNWSPDGRTIAFSSRREDTTTDVHLMDPDGNVFRNVTQSLREDSWPNWSPDGTQIVFHSRLDDPDGEEIYRIRPDGTGRTRLTFNPGPVQGSFDIFPAWSPDGTRIVWNSGRNANNFGEIYQMSAVTGDVDIVRVTNSPATDQRCDWQPLCTIYGAGNIAGTRGNDVICGSPGDDFIAASSGNDTIIGLGGNDRIYGGSGNDNAFGGFGSDQVTGGDGNDVVSGGPGVDSVTGDAGTDHADGGYGSDTCYYSETRRECEAPAPTTP